MKTKRIFLRKQFFKLAVITCSVLLIITIGLFADVPTEAPKTHKASADAQNTNGLVLWNGLGSDGEVLNSFVGPALTFYTGGSGAEVQGDREYVSGYSGNGVTLKGSYSNMDRIHNIVLNNLGSYLNPEKGSIEFWYYYTDSPISYSHGVYRFFGGAYGLGSGMAFQAVYPAGGRPARIHFDLNFNATATEVWYDLANINTNEWVHIAASWDRNGIAGSADSMQLYVNNVLVTAASQNNWGTTVGQQVDICGGNDHNIIGKFKMDELKIWNYAKTSFFAPPTVTTTTVSSITATSASCGGNVTSDGGAAVTARGVCWSPSANPTTADSHTTDGTGTGVFTSTITALTPGRTYHVRAYAVNISYTSYGSDITFTTPPIAPTIVTTAASDVTSTTASSGGNIISDGGAAVTARGVCWSPSANPTIADSHTADGTGTGVFTSTITALTPGRTYHVRAYAVNSVGTSYGSDITFTTPSIAPTIVTTAVSDVTSTTASCGGNITSDGGAAVTARGVCWSPSANPTTADSHTADGTGTGVFTSTITALTPGRTYHVRAYAVNISGTSYGSDITFTTPSIAPTIVTTAVSDVTSTTASCGGNITSDGGAAVTARGVCWCPSANPTTADSHTTDGTGTGVFTSVLPGLLPGTTYFVRAYATNSVGTSYGSEETFTTITVIPTVTTAAMSAITLFSASGGGNVTTHGGAPVTVRGVCWNTSQNPTTTDNSTEDGSGVGTFTSSLTDLTANTTYYVRTYATNTVGTAYGNEVTFSTPQLPHIRLSRTGFNFGAITDGPQTGPQEFLVGNSGGWFLDWNATPSEPWITVSTATGSGKTLVTLSVDAAGLAPGSYTGSVSIADGNADNSPATVDVFLEVKQKSDEKPLIGSFDSPADGAAVFSSVPICGWALDDSDVSTVKIYRNAVLPQEQDLVYVGDAVLVDGLRPDIEGKYPGYPKNYMAGWGYLMLTNGLPDGGNGTYIITAIGTDNSGNQVTLGSKTIQCDNASAVKPFGAIDTPTQGGDASGIYFSNFGWALTPLPNTIPTDGSTIKVWVDGVPLAGNPMYNLYREDIATRFPGYNNSDGAVGCYYLDTTGYENGMHLIAWGVVDDAGNAEGIGSRFFRVLNVSNPKNRFNPFPGYGDKWAIDNLPPSLSPVHLKRDCNRAAENTLPTETLYPDKQGLIKITIVEMERIEIKMGTQCLGYMTVGGELRNLPTGSFADKKRGVFYWQPGPGFLGNYQLLFVVKEQNSEITRRKIKITVKGKY